MSDTTALHPTEIGPAVRGVIVVTDDDDTPQLAAARVFAAELAVRSGVTLTLYDRSQETWGDSQHPMGPMDRDDERLPPHLVDQFDGLAHTGADVQAWVPSLPTISAVLTALAGVEADVVVISEAMSRKLLERALTGDSLAASLKVQIDRQPQFDTTILEVQDDGGVIVVRPTAGAATTNGEPAGS